jgi:hypothetical protein
MRFNVPQNDTGRHPHGEPPNVGQAKGIAMSGNAITQQLEAQIEKTSTKNDAWARFVETSFQEELDAGVSESIAASKWLQKLTGATK